MSCYSECTAVAPPKNCILNPNILTLLRMVSQPTFNFRARTFQITQFINLSWLNHPTRIGIAVVPFRIVPVKITIIFGIYLLMYLENMIFYTFDGFFSIACNHFIHIVFIVFWSSSRNRAACPPSICTWWNWKEMGKVVLSQPLR